MSNAESGLNDLGRDPVAKRGLDTAPLIQPLCTTASGYHERFGALLYPSRKLQNNNFSLNKNSSLTVFRKQKKSRL